MPLQGFDSEYVLDGLLELGKETYPDEWGNVTRDDIDALVLEVYAAEATLAGLNGAAEAFYNEWGWKWDIAPNEYFDANEYKASYISALVQGGSTESQAALKLAMELGAFDGGLDADGTDPYLHYLDTGASIFVDPSGEFDESAYVEALAELLGSTVEETLDLMENLGLDSALSVHFAFDPDENIIEVTPVVPVVDDRAEAPFVLDDYKGDFDTDGSGLKITITTDDGMTLNNDRIEADTLYNLETSDKINGGDGDDVIEGYYGNDQLNGSFGNDTLDGGRGDDRLVGADGDDVYVYRFESSEDSIVGVDGSDIVFLEDGDHIQFQDLAGEIDTVDELNAAVDSGEITLVDADGSVLVQLADSNYTDQGASGAGQITIVGAALVEGEAFFSSDFISFA